MPGRDADKNLLFGILAVQMDFVTRDELIAAMHAWVLEKHRPLAEILVERGALKPAERGVLEPMVNLHVARHGGDPERSLAALTSTSGLVGDLGRALADSEVRRSLGTVGSTASVDAFATRTFQHADPRSAGTRYRKVRDHAKGGLGVVFVARDEELNREVALKEIHDHHADNPGSRARFVLEAEVTGGLEHPGIVPVYGLGKYDDGRPFYAMRFIRGDSLKDAIGRFHAAEGAGREAGERRLALQELLRRFLDVCNAIDYAHSRGVLHRDLKPNNIMVGRYGETLVVDWGLARASGRSGDGEGISAESALRPSSASSLGETLPGSVVGTPGYMSPEQAEGRLDLLGPASDVYSLGATLYALLTNRAPFLDKDLGEILRKVRAGEFPRPREVTRWVDPALEAVCLKAMALRPADRYASPRALGEDVKRWVADEPVSSYREPATVRARRWLRRHRTLTTSAAAVALAGLVALGVGYFRESKLNSRLQAAKKQVDDANGKLSRSNADLTAALADARRARATADQRLDQTFHAIEGYYSGVGREVLLGREEFRGLRERLLEDPRQFYEVMTAQLSEVAKPDARSKALLARGRDSLAQISMLLGRFDAARREYTASMEGWQQLIGDHPDDLEYKEGLAKSSTNLGIVLNATGQRAEAEAALRKAGEAWEGIVARRGSPQTLDAMAKNYANLAMLLRDAGRVAESDATFLKAIAAWETLAALPDSAGFSVELANSYRYLGLSLLATGRLAESEAACRKAVAAWGTILAAKPTSPEYRDGPARAYSTLGYALRDQGKLGEAEAACLKAVEAWKAAIAAEPNSTDFKDGMAANYGILGILYRNTRRPGEAAAVLRRAAELGEDLVALQPDLVQYRDGLAKNYVNLGNVLRNDGRPGEAETACRKAIRIFSGQLEDQPASLMYRNLAGIAYQNLGDSLQDLGRPEEAVGAFREAIRLSRKVFDQQPQVAPYRRLLSNHYQGLATSLRSLGRADEAAGATRERRKLWPRNPGELYNLACELSLCVPISDDPARRPSLADEAMGALRAAVAFGWHDGNHTAQDPDLVPLHDRDDFRGLVLGLLDRQFPAEPFAK